jgi:hypothetical protein
MDDVGADAVPTTEVFLDDRGSLLRVRWDEDAQQLAVTVWRDGVCIATHRLGHADTARLSSMLTQAWIDGLRRSASASASASD